MKTSDRPESQRVPASPAKGTLGQRTLDLVLGGVAQVRGLPARTDVHQGALPWPTTGGKGAHDFRVEEAPNSYGVLFRAAAEKYGAKVALRTKHGSSWREWSYRKVVMEVDLVAAALLELGLNECESVCIFSHNCPEWTLVDLAAISIRCLAVPIYGTSTSKQAEYIVKDAGAKVLFVGDQQQYDDSRVLLENGIVKAIVAFDDAVHFRGQSGAMHYAELRRLGENSSRKSEIPERLARAKPDDLLTIVYTSGTTGEPKGVMMTHDSLYYQLLAHSERLPAIDDKDVSLSFLPLAHVFERLWVYFVLFRGMTIAYLLDPKDIVTFIQEAKPTFMCTVPRLCEKVHTAVLAKAHAAPMSQRMVFDWAFRVGMEVVKVRRSGLQLSAGLEKKYALADSLVLHKVREAFGGRLRCMPCAGSPLASDVDEFLWAAGVPVFYGYGMTETNATVCCRDPAEFQFGHVGRPLAFVEVKIGDNNEILVRGPTITKGYFKKPKETAEAFDSDGWLHTGDAGQFHANGELRITDRIKELMKTSGGKYISPQLVEGSLASDVYIEQVAAIADNRKYVSALIVPAFAALEAYAQSHGMAFSSQEDLIKHPDIVKLYYDRLGDLQKDLAPYERVKKITLLSTPFSVENGDLTPTQKLKRKAIDQRYKHLIDAMYASA